MVSKAQEVNAVGELERKVAESRSALLSLRDQLSKVLIGQESIVDQALLCVLANGHVLLEGTPGLGKTLFIKALAKTMGLKMARIQFTPDLMPADILGGERLTEAEGGVVTVFRKGPVFTEVLLADEINRANPRTQSALLEAMGEGHVTVAGATTALPQPFFVFASQNPVEMHGTYPLPEAQLDRFMMRLQLQRPTVNDLPRIMGLNSSELLDSVPICFTREQLSEAQALVGAVPASSEVLDQIGHIIERTWALCQIEIQGRKVGMGASPRAAQDLFRACQARAIVSGRLNVSLDDVRALCVPVLNHRILLPMALRAEGATAPKLIGEIIAHVLG